MIRDPHVLLKHLYANPESWPVRMALIEELVRDGEIDRAKLMIRESPDSVPMPADYPLRIHTLMTKGIEGLKTLPPLPGFEDRPEPEEEEEIADSADFTPVPPAKTDSSGKSASFDEVSEMERRREQQAAKNLEKDDKTFSADDRHQFREPEFQFQVRKVEISKDGEMSLPAAKGGAAALVEDKTIHRKSGPKPPAPTIDQEIAAIKWEKYSGKLQLTAGTIPDSVGKPSRSADRLSAISLAVIVHLFVAILVSLVVINTPRPNPPKLVITMPDDNDADDLIVHKLTKPAEIEPSAASVQAVNVLTSVNMTAFNLPEVEDTTSLDVTAMVDGVASAGAGMMRLSLETHQQSDVNFFGISSGGESIVFVIDATRPMLVDEKGGMFAYDKVKNEIGAMLSNLNRGTKFNLLVYSGKTVRAFRDNLVPGLPSNKRLAMEWLEPLNSDYDNLGIGRDYGIPMEVQNLEGLPIAAHDVAHYTKCIQKAMEWQAAAIFCISGGYQNMGRSPTPEMMEEMRKNNQGSRGELDPSDKARYERDRAKWQAAVQRTREWLEKENAARKEKGLAPKVVVNFNDLVREITGATPPRGQARTGGSRNNNNMRLPNVNLDEIDVHLRKLVINYYHKKNKDVPSVHMVVFLGEDEEFRDQDKDHFRRIVRRNNGKMKMLRGLAALEDVTER